MHCVNTSCRRTCKLVGRLLWVRVLIGRCSRLVLVLWRRSGQVSLPLLLLHRHMERVTVWASDLGQTRGVTHYHVATEGKQCNDNNGIN